MGSRGRRKGGVMTWTVYTRHGTAWRPRGCFYARTPYRAALAAQALFGGTVFGVKESVRRTRLKVFRIPPGRWKVRLRREPKLLGAILDLALRKIGGMIYDAKVPGWREISKVFH